MSLLADERLSLSRVTLFACRWWVFAIVASIQCANQLGEDSPHEVLLSKPVPILQLSDVPSQISITAILHVQMQVMTRLQVLTMAILHDIGMAQTLQNPKLGVQLLLLPIRHACVGYLFAAQHLAISLASYLSDDTKGSLSNLLQNFIVVVGSHGMRVVFVLALSECVSVTARKDRLDMEHKKPCRRSSARESYVDIEW